VSLPATLAEDRRLAAAARRAVRRHLLPEPPLELARWLGRQRRAAAIDVSDGLALDLARLCRESRAGATLDGSALFDREDFAPLATAVGEDPLALALGGGEDYTLLFALPGGIEPPARFACRKVGTIESAPGIFLLHDGARHPLAETGWDHLRQWRRGNGRERGREIS
jgi:thiamine-monophosphate kinase